MTKTKKINPLFWKIPCVIIAAGISFFGMYYKCDTTLVLALSGMFLVAAFGKKITNAIGVFKK
jgi:hypothetical protein